MAVNILFLFFLFIFLSVTLFSFERAIRQLLCARGILITGVYGENNFYHGNGGNPALILCSHVVLTAGCRGANILPP